MLSSDQPSVERRRELLDHLPRKRLQFLTGLYDLEVADRRKRALYVDALINADIDIWSLFVVLSHEDLKGIARGLKVDVAGQDKQQLIDAVLAVATDAGGGSILVAARAVCSWAWTTISNGQTRGFVPIMSPEAERLGFGY